MEAAVLITGRSGSGISTVMRALLSYAPERARCLTFTTTLAPHREHVKHPLRPDWSEYCYVNAQTYERLRQMDQFAINAELEGRYDVAVSNATLRNVLEFDGMVVAAIPVIYAEIVQTMFAHVKRTTPGFFLDVPDDVLYSRLQKRGYDEEKIAKKMLATRDWPMIAAKLGFITIQNPDDIKGHPHVALKQLFKAFGMDTDFSVKRS